MEFLSDIELYFTPPSKIIEDRLVIEDEEFRHITKVMRHSSDEEIYVTDGEGKIYKGIIEETTKKHLVVKSIKIFKYKNDFKNITFCIPKLKSRSRFEFALEKCTELGITSFVIFESKRSEAKTKRLDRWNKIVVSAMKQSLRSYLPKIILVNSVKEISQLEGEKIVFDQNSKYNFTEYKIELDKKHNFIFGPEGGLTEDELSLFKNKFFLSSNRLRTETAVIKAASFI